MLAVIVFEVLLVGEVVNLPLTALGLIARTLFVGISLGLILAFVLIQMLKKYWLPDFLQNPVALMLIVCAFTVSKVFQVGSGLMAATVMGGQLMAITANVEINTLAALHFTQVFGRAKVDQLEPKNKKWVKNLII